MNVDSYKVGSGETQILILHGSGSAAKPFGRLGKHIVDTLPDTEVTVLSLAGYGSQASDLSKPILSQHMELIQRVVSAASEGDGPRPWHLVGHSMGGFLALQAALSMPSTIASLSLVEPTALGVLHAEEDQDAIEADRSVVRKFTEGLDNGTGIGHFIEAWNQSPWSEMPDFVRGVLTDQAAQIHDEVIGVSYDETGLDAYAALSVPILLLGGEQTLLPARRVVEKLSVLDQVTGVHWVEGAKHMAVVQRPDAFAGAIARHIDRVIVSCGKGSKERTFDMQQS